MSERSVSYVELCLRSWYGHPEERSVTVQRELNKRQHRPPSYPVDSEHWVSGLRCWKLYDQGGIIVGRVYEPTPDTPRWVWVDQGGGKQIRPLLSEDQLTVMMVEYRLKGGFV